MAKTTYIYLSDYDAHKITEWMSSLGALCYDKEGKVVEALPSLTNDISMFKICFGENVSIDYSPCININGFLQLGFFRSTNVNNRDELAKYNLIKKYIKNNFRYSKLNMCYYGPDFYDDWWNYKLGLMLPTFLESEQIEINANEIDAVFEEIRELGFTIKPDRVRLRNIDIIDPSFDSFVIFSDVRNMNRIIIKKSIVCYDYDSKCIFVIKNEKRKTFSFFLDARIRAQNITDLVDLFEMLSSRGDE